MLDELPVVHYQLLALGGPVRVAPYATFGTDELAEATLDALGCAVAGLVAQGLGSDHGDFDLDAADALIKHSNRAVSR